MKELQGSDGTQCKKTKLEVNNFSTQVCRIIISILITVDDHDGDHDPHVDDHDDKVVAGTMYEFDLVLNHAEDSAAE